MSIGTRILEELEKRIQRGQRIVDSPLYTVSQKDWARAAVQADRSMLEYVKREKLSGTSEPDNIIALRAENAAMKKVVAAAREIVCHDDTENMSCDMYEDALTDNNGCLGCQDYPVRLALGALDAAKEDE